MRTEKLVDKDSGVLSAVETLSVDIITQEEHTVNVSTVLKRRREWSDPGGMTSDELEDTSASRRALWASSEKCAQNGKLDMRKRVQHWKKVRLRWPCRSRHPGFLP